MKELIDLQNNAPQRDSLKSFMLARLKEVAGDKAMKGESVVGFPEAKLIIEDLFVELDKMVSKK